VDREQQEQANRVLREQLKAKLEANRFVLTAEGRIVRAEELRPHSNETGEGEHES
jgi:hypothetical protein